LVVVAYAAAIQGGGTGEGSVLISARLDCIASAMAAFRAKRSARYLHPCGSHRRAGSRGALPDALLPHESPHSRFAFAGQAVLQGNIVNIAHYACTRRTTKAFDPTRSVPREKIEQLRELIRFSPSSVNSQPWHFVIASSAEGKDRIAAAAEGRYAYNKPKIQAASHLIVLCAREQMTPAHLDAILAQEERDERFIIPDARKSQQASRESYVDMHRYTLKDAQHWMEKQVYLALGTLLLGAAALEVDACPMEGFDAQVLDRELGLREKGFTSVVLVGLGYSADTDFKRKLPKSRLPAATIFTDI
jgi:nitroreductase / dihydropteridine reductase